MDVVYFLFCKDSLSSFVLPWGLSREVLGGPWRSLGDVWACPWWSLGCPFRVSLRGPGGSSGGSRGCLGRSPEAPKREKVLLECLGGFWGPSCGLALGSIPERANVDISLVITVLSRSEVFCEVFPDHF